MNGPNERPEEWPEWRGFSRAALVRLLAAGWRPAVHSERCTTFCAGIIGDSLTVRFPLTTLLLRQRHSLLDDFAGDLAREPLWKLNDFHGSVPECALKHRWKFSSVAVEWSLYRPVALILSQNFWPNRSALSPFYLSVLAQRISHETISVK